MTSRWGALRTWWGARRSAEQRLSRRVSRDGGYRLDICRRADGLMRFVADARRIELGDPVWVPMHFSGLYDDRGALERDARAPFAWLETTDSAIAGKERP